MCQGMQVWLQWSRRDTLYGNFPVGAVVNEPITRGSLRILACLRRCKQGQVDMFQGKLCALCNIDELDYKAAFPSLSYSGTQYI
jgi:hypothetical protein